MWEFSVPFCGDSGGRGGGGGGRTGGFGTEEWGIGVGTPDEE